MTSTLTLSCFFNDFEKALLEIVDYKKKIDIQIAVRILNNPKIFVYAGEVVEDRDIVTNLNLIKAALFIHSKFKTALHDLKSASDSFHIYKWKHDFKSIK
jgi:hypothetical protein